ncbi:MAG: hypothetical protein JXA71_12305 [Chitinispirillaceae bacterium]|nr:hypothetical protein [Chitinispirillaceae bacterium]
MIIRCVVIAALALGFCCASQKASAKNAKSAQDHITFSGGSGDSHEDAIVINGVLKQSEGIEAEYRYLSKVYGIKDKNWKVDGQTMYREEKKVFDVIEIMLIPSGERRIYYFDVSGFPWKRKGIQ